MMLSKSEVAVIRERAAYVEDALDVQPTVLALIDTIEAFAEALEMTLKPMTWPLEDRVAVARQDARRLLATWHASPTEDESIFENRVRRFGPGGGGWSGHSLPPDSAPTEGGTPDALQG